MTQTTNEAARGGLPNSPQASAPFVRPNYSPHNGTSVPKKASQVVHNLVTTALRLKASAMMVLCNSAISTARTYAHDTAGRKPGDDLGSANGETDFSSTLAELLVMGSLLRAGYQPEGYIAFCVHPTKDPDFRLFGRSFDIKSVAAGKNYVTINASKHEQHAPDFYLIVIFDSQTTATVALVPAGDVDRFWQRREGHSSYYSVHRDRLPLLSSWSELEVCHE